MSAPNDERAAELARRLREAVRAAGATPAQWEASVRSERGQLAPGERVMIEQASEAVCRSVFEVLGVPVPAEARAMLQLAERTGTPLIAGWDLCGEPVAKLYLNASDRSAAVRAELAAALGWNGLDALPGPPHLCAINATRGRVVRKAYHQGATLDEAFGFRLPGELPSSLFAGVVVSHELPVSEAPVARAAFAAIRDRMDGEVEAWLGSMRGWDRAAIDAALPFPRGHCRSVGWNASGDWVAYFKPAGAGVPLEALEPIAVFTAEGHDVAVFVEPRREGRRAFATTEHLAISFRGGETAPRTTTAPLHAWVLERVLLAERTGRDPEAVLLDPPAPWRRERRALRRLVETADDDRYFDYCLQPYEPRRSARGGLRGETLLWESLAVAGASADLGRLLDRVREHAGKDATIWGTKWLEDRLSWELYFYDPQKEHPRVHATDLGPALGPALTFAAPLRADLPYMMWSFDLFPDFSPGTVVESVNYYLAEPVGQAGRSYKATATRTELDNVYHFFHPKTAIREVLSRIRSSAFVDFTRLDVAKVLFPELFTCQKICVAKKRTADAVYYSGITIEQLLWFLERFAYPAPLVRFARAHRARFEHLRFDVGIDYRLDAGGRLITPKSSFYSSL